jgi:hypothetical protein
MQENQDKERSTVKVQRKREYQKIQVGARFSVPVHLASVYSGCGSLSRGQNNRVMALTTHPHLGAEVKERV